MTEIVENELFLGSIIDANNIEFLTKNKITAIICVADHAVVEQINPNIKIYQYDLSDDSICNINLYFDEISKLIEKEDVVLINCMAGISRSPSIVLAYLMKYFRFSLKGAYERVLSKKRDICPNQHFLECLLKYEFKVFGRNSLTYEECIDLFYT